MSLQSNFVERIRNAAGDVIQIVEQVETLEKVAIARGYQNWTNAQVADIDINGTPLTMAELIGMFQRFAELRAFMDNQAVAAMDRRTAFNKFRGDV